jgi:nucleotide-binding universal stress UspA family protein
MKRRLVPPGAAAGSEDSTTPSGGRRIAAAPGATTGATRDTVSDRRLNGTIVCVIDESEGAEAALHVARRLAEQFDARMLLVSTTHGIGGIDEGVTAMQAEAGARQRLRRLTAQGALDEEERVATGDPAEAVARIAAEEAADLIVVGARRGLRAQTFRSSHAGDLAATASCPVVVAPPGPRNADDGRSRRFLGGV